MHGEGFTCNADWPSESLEVCKFDGEGNRAKSIGSRIANRSLPELTTVQYIDDDLEDEIINRKNIHHNPRK